MINERQPKDENAPEWMIKIKGRYTNGTAYYIYVTRPSELPQSEWEAMKLYYANKNKPSFYDYVARNPDELVKHMNICILQANNYMHSTVANERFLTEKTQFKSEHEKQEILEMLRLVNELRVEHGLNPVILSEPLCEAASIRAKEMKDRQEHTRPDETNCRTVFDEVGLGWRNYLDPIYTTDMSSNENLTFLLGNATSYNYSASEAFKDLYHSRGHLVNMLDPTTTHVGFGLYEGEVVGWIQIFANSVYTKKDQI